MNFDLDTYFYQKEVNSKSIVIKYDISDNSKLSKNWNALKWGGTHIGPDVENFTLVGSK